VDSPKADARSAQHEENVMEVTEYAAAYALGEQVLDMIDRLKVVDPCAPGSEARLFPVIDGKRYSVTIKLAQVQP
jgi:hypothetical protein